jgi:hypothetical protein
MGTTPPAQLISLNTVVSTAISSVFAIVGAIFILMLIVAGFNFLNAGTNRDAAAKAQRSLTNAFLGFVVVISAWLILRLLGTFLGITNFGIFDICIVTGC